mgnify:CR=1 FL=1
MATGSMGYRVGRAIGSMPRGLRLGLLGAIVGAGILSYWTNKIASDQAEAAAARVATQAAQERQAQAQLAAAQRKAMIERCTGQRASIVAASNSALSRGALADAMDGIRQCVDALPLDAGYRDQFRLVDIAVKRQAEKDRALVAAAEKSQKRREGVRIGMSMDDVLASSWGRPQSVNRTTTAFGTSEQWVYSSGGYLYFTDGVLTAVQN